MPDWRVLWTETARLDLEHIAGFVAEDSPSNALMLVNRIERRCQTLKALPHRGRVVPELRAVDIQIYRELIEGPWRIIYRHDESSVYVMAVIDARRDLSSLLLERLVR